MGVIINKTMNNTDIKQEINQEKVEWYLLLIVIKLAVIISVKLLKSCVKIYKLHNHKVINRHNKTSIEKLKKKREAPNDMGTTSNTS